MKHLALQNENAFTICGALIEKLAAFDDFILVEEAYPEMDEDWCISCLSNFVYEGYGKMYPAEIKERLSKIVKGKSQ